MNIVTSAVDIWRAVLGDLQVQVPKPVFETWLKHTCGVTLQGNAIDVEAPTAFGVEWLERSMYQIVLKTLHRVTGESMDVRFRVASQPSASIQWASAPSEKASPSSAPDSPRLNGRFTFSSFVVGTSNHLAFSAAQAVAEAPGRAYNPLFIYSSAGLGKTHLLHATGRICAQRNSRVVYVTSEQFTNEFIQGIRTRSTEEFRARYRGADVLLVDDIQFIAGKEQTQEGFFHTFNELHNSNKQIVIAADRPPRSLSLLEERLRSRFESGLIADIQAPPLETRIAILRSKAERMSAHIDDDVLEYIATRLDSNVRELEGALNRVTALARIHQQSITVGLAREALTDITANEQRPQPTPDEVIQAVAHRFSTTVADIKGTRRIKKLTVTRHLTMYILHRYLGLGVTEIGTLLGGRDHSTVIHGVKRATQLLQSEPDLSTATGQLCDTLAIQLT